MSVTVVGLTAAFGLAGGFLGLISAEFSSSQSSSPIYVGVAIGAAFGYFVGAGTEKAADAVFSTPTPASTSALDDCSKKAEMMGRAFEFKKNADGSTSCLIHPAAPKP